MELDQFLLLMELGHRERCYCMAKRFLSWYPGRGHHDPRLYSDMEALATHPHVLTTTGLYNDYTFHSVLSPKKLKLDHQTVFPCERVWSGHDTREGE